MDVEPERRMPRLMMACLHGVMLLMLCVPLLSGAAEVVVVVDEGNTIYRRFLDGFNDQVEGWRAPRTVEYVHPAKAQQEKARIAGAAAVLTVGLSAAQEIGGLAVNVPTIQSLLSKSEQSEMPGATAANGKVTSLYIDQPPIRMLTLVKAAMPETVAVTIGIGENSQRFANEIKAACLKLRLECATVFMRDGMEIENAMEHAAHSGRVLVIFPDPLVINAATAKTLILGAFMRGVALVGYSQAMVKAGALMAVYSTPEQLGMDAANMVNEVLNSHRLPPSHYPKLFSVSVNYQLARALRLDMRSEDALRQSIERAERHD